MVPDSSAVPIGLPAWSLDSNLGAAPHFGSAVTECWIDPFQKKYAGRKITPAIRRRIVAPTNCFRGDRETGTGISKDSPQRQRGHNEIDCGRYPLTTASQARQRSTGAPYDAGHQKRETRNRQSHKTAAGFLARSAPQGRTLMSSKLDWSNP